LNHNQLIKKLFLILILPFLSTQSYAGSCPDGSEPVKSISADGTYFVFECNVSSAPVNSTEPGTVSLSSAVQQSTTTGIWFPDEVMYSPHFVKASQQFRRKSWNSTHWQFADFDNDGIQDFFVITNPMQKGRDWDAATPECDTSIGSCFALEDTPFSLIKVGKSSNEFYPFNGVEVTDDFFIDNNPIEMKGIDSTDLQLADFNGDGVFDIFTAENSNIGGDRSGKNDMYFLSQPDGTWLESTATHVTGEWYNQNGGNQGHGVKKGKGLINFSHGSSIGDIDGDGDIDIVVTSINWDGWQKSRSKRTENGWIWCYENQGDGHMKVRQCGDQWGMTAELGDIDNDGDLDLVWGSRQMAWTKDWGQEQIPGCTSKNHCNGTFSGILLNDGTGNFYERGFEFEDMFTKTTGFAYQSSPAVAVIDLDGDDDLDVIRSLVGNLYAGAGMTIEENIGNGQFRTVLHDEFCVGPKSQSDWPTYEGSRYNCWIDDFKFGDFNKDGLIDIYLDGHDADKSDVISDGTIYMSNGKFGYDIITPYDKGYPLKNLKLKVTREHDIRD